MKNQGLKASLNRLFRNRSQGSISSNIYHSAVLDSLNNEQYYELSPGFSDAILRQVSSEPSQKADIIIFPSTDWEPLVQKSQQLALQLAEAGHRVFCVHTSFSHKKPMQIRKVGQKVFLLRLPRSGEAVFPGDTLSIDDIVSFSNSIADVTAAFNIHSAIVMVDLPFWQGLVLQLCNETGWMQVYTYPNEHADSSLNNMSITRDEQQLLSQSDLVIFSSELLQQKMGSGIKNSIVMPGVLDLELPEQSSPGITRANPWKAQVDALESAFYQLFPKISIIVVTYNKVEYTRMCLDSIIRNTEYTNYEIVIVDNASNDGTVEYIKEFTTNHIQTKFIQNDHNQGFAAANNLGAGSASGDYLVMLNNDTIVTPGWLHRMLFHLHKYAGAGMVGPVTNAIGNEAKIKVNYTQHSDINYFAARRARKYRGISFSIRVLALYCAMISRSLYEQLGGLDERYHVGMFEDDDLALKIQQAGFNLRCAEDVFIHHFHGASFNQYENQELQRIFHENKEKFEEKWGVSWQPHQNRPHSS